LVDPSRCQRLGIIRGSSPTDTATGPLQLSGRARWAGVCAF